MNRTYRKKKTWSFASMRIIGWFASTSLEDMRKAGSKAGQALMRMK